MYRRLLVIVLAIYSIHTTLGVIVFAAEKTSSEDMQSITVTNELVIQKQTGETKKATLPRGTTITTVSSDPIAMTDIAINNTISRPFPGSSIASFHFGITDKHLVFSQPVRLDIPVTSPDGTELNVFVYHTGDESYSQVGLTSSSNAQCLANGSASKDPTTSIVQNGMITVYTCGASDFVVSPIPVVDFVDNSTLNKIIPVTTLDTGGENIITSVTATIDFRSIAGTNPANPSNGKSNSSQLSFRLTSPSGTTISLLNANTYNNAKANRVTVVFDDLASTIISGKPTAGTYLPAQPLSTFNGTNALGNWIFSVTDNTIGDGMILYSVNLHFITQATVGTIALHSSSVIDLGLYQPQIIDQIITKTLTGAFGVSDTVGSNTGRYTTLQASDMIGLNDTIAASNLAISHPGAIVVASGTVNPRVVFGTGIQSGYVSLTNPVTYLMRATAPNSGVTGSYTTNPSFRFTIPAFQSPSNYTGVITYTLYSY